MPQSVEKKWPRNGFEPYFDYVSNFLHLNINLGGPEGCKAYHDNWMRRYNSAMTKWSSYEAAIWSVRCRQSLKLSFSATFFALSADKVGSTTTIKSAEYYLAYYSMLHAMWAVIYLHPEQSLDHVTAITHSKIANVFHSEFASGTNPVIVENEKELAEDLRFLREYYSYRMPLNSPFAASPSLSLSYSRLGGFVKQSIQLANLHSHMIRKVAERIGKCSAAVSVSEQAAFRDAFFKINGKEHQPRGLRLLDEADMQAQSELITMGCDLLPLSLGYDHMFDNFMTWDQDRPDEKMLQRVRSLVGNALF
ncbi:hypothetical protein HPT29_002235 [Microvirga terrae]|uniref:Uncharacterized protein n=1 Tax=Microvirga terrae TaxID=2740529 RepID=A0ABY5RUY7_9HYPH|nr:hypothetical protein [Microvirga terrae]UVF19992.1 hypothetical protein HPT29_002235 [Microvirga terrae]